MKPGVGDWHANSETKRRRTLRSLHVRQQLDNEADDVRRRFGAGAGGGEDGSMDEFWGSAWRAELSTFGGGLKGSW